ncbi:MAG: tetratricopeptide repeat protein [Armatimonadota bacterium]
MKKTYSKVLIFIMLVVFLSSSCVYAAPKTVKEIINYAKYGTVVIEVFKNGKPLGSGSGFFISNDEVVTNYHVIEGSDAIIVKTYNKQEYRVKKIIALDQSYDIAVLKLATPATGIKILTMADQLPEQGDDVLVIGAPLSFDYTVTRGIVTAIRDMERNGTCIQIDASISPGNSGGPVLNNNSEVIGIATFFIPGTKEAPGQNLNFAASVGYVKYLLNMGYKKFVTDESYKRALEYYMAGEDEKALPLLKPYADSHPDNADAWFYTGVCYYYTGRYENSIDCMNRVLQLDKNDYTAYNYIASNLIKLKEYNEAIKYCDKSLAIKPSGQESASAYNNKGLCYYETQRYYDAIDYYEKALRQKPTNTLFMNNMGLAYEKLKDYKKALNCYDKAIKVNPNDPSAYYNIGYLYYLDKQDETASTYFTKAIKLDPGFSLAYYYMGNIFYDKKDYKKAYNLYLATIETNPYYDLAYTGAGLCLMQSGDNETAIKYFLKAIEIYKNNPEALYSLGVAYLNLGDKEAALEVYGYLRGVDRKSANALYDLINKP